MRLTDEQLRDIVAFGNQSKHWHPMALANTAAELLQYRALGAVEEIDAMVKWSKGKSAVDEYLSVKGQLFDMTKERDAARREAEELRRKLDEARKVAGELHRKREVIGISRREHSNVYRIDEISANLMKRLRAIADGR